MTTSRKLNQKPTMALEAARCRTGQKFNSTSSSVLYLRRVTMNPHDGRSSVAMLEPKVDPSSCLEYVCDVLCLDRVVHATLVSCRSTALLVELNL